MRNRLSSIIWGVIFIVIGVGFAGNVLFDWDFHLFFDGWWTLFIIIPCFVSMIQNGFAVGSFTGFIIGILLFLSSQDFIVFDFNIWSLIVPVILVLIGIRIMFQGSTHRGRNIQPNSYIDGNQTYTNRVKGEYSAIFSSNRVHLENEAFFGTNLTAVFGSIGLDLRDTIIDHDIEISATAVFGGIDIFIPVGVKVKVNNVPVFGGVSNKAATSNDPGAPTIYLNSTCMFGGIDIK